LFYFDSETTSGVGGLCFEVNILGDKGAFGGKLRKSTSGDLALGFSDL